MCAKFTNNVQKLKSVYMIHKKEFVCGKKISKLPGIEKMNEEMIGLSSWSRVAVLEWMVKSRW